MVKVILSEDLAKRYAELEKEVTSGNCSNEKELKLIRKGIELLSISPTHGLKIPHSLPIFTYYAKKFEVDNLWKLDVSQEWRLIYTLGNDEIEIIAFVLELLDHKDYDKIGGYQ